MRIILDTDKKLITVPWNYAAKLDEMNTDAHLKVADKPAKRGK